MRPAVAGAAASVCARAAAAGRAARGSWAGRRLFCCSAPAAAMSAVIEREFQEIDATNDWQARYLVSGEGVRWSDGERAAVRRRRYAEARRSGSCRGATRSQVHAAQLRAGGAHAPGLRLAFPFLFPCGEGCGGAARRRRRGAVAAATARQPAACVRAAPAHVRRLRSGAWAEADGLPRPSRVPQPTSAGLRRSGPVAAGSACEVLIQMVPALGCVLRCSLK